MRLSERARIARDQSAVPGPPEAVTPAAAAPRTGNGPVATATGEAAPLPTAPRGPAPTSPAGQSPAPSGAPREADAGQPRRPVSVATSKVDAENPRDAVVLLKERVTAALFERIGARMTDPSLDEARLQSLVRAELNHVVEAEKVPLTPAERRRLMDAVEDDVLGHGPLERLLNDETISEIMVNGPDRIYVEQKGKLRLSPVTFASEEQLRGVIDRIVSRVGRRIDDSSPLVDARLPDGSRVNAVIPPLAFSGSTLTIRKFSKDPLRVDDLIRFGSISPEMAELLHACVQARLNIIVSGGTGTGKTTLLNVLSSFIPGDERIVTIEDAVELQLQQDHVVRLESRPPNIEGKGEISIRELVRNSLRMRPDRIVVGECRGGESLDMLQAMNTGHDGSLSTVHANSPRDAIARMETLVLMAGMDLPLRAIREQIASAVDLVVQLTRMKDGSRRVTHVTEVQGMEGDTVTLQDAFLFDYSAGVDEQGRYLGKPVPTGVRPRFTDKFDDMGIKVSPRVFASPEPARRAG